MQRSVQLHFFESLDSTQLQAKKMKIEKNHLDCIAAFCQTKGKGTFGREWLSPKGSGLYVTFAFKSDVKEHLNCLSLLGSCAACLLCDPICPNLKWPNDIQIEGKKLGGVLTEIIDGTIYVGIGLNIKKTEGLEEKVDQPITFYENYKQAPNLKEMVITLSCHFNHLLEAWEKQGFLGFRSIYEKYFKLIGHEILIETSEGLVKGILQGFSENGYPILLQGHHILEIKNVKHIYLP